MADYHPPGKVSIKQLVWSGVAISASFVAG